MVPATKLPRKSPDECARNSTGAHRLALARVAVALICERCSDCCNFPNPVNSALNYEYSSIYITYVW
eukprot:SAG31_NODE_38708_length_294_cov_0.661538_1_plen_66_part_10